MCSANVQSYYEQQKTSLQEEVMKGVLPNLPNLTSSEVPSVIKATKVTVFS
jgi:hypothetical protein